MMMMMMMMMIIIIIIIIKQVTKYNLTLIPMLLQYSQNRKVIKEESFQE